MIPDEISKMIPYKIYVSDLIYNTWQYTVPNPDDDTEAEYIHKDALLKWAKERQAFYRKRAEDIGDDNNSDFHFFYGKKAAFKELIDKLESL